MSNNPLHPLIIGIRTSKRIRQHTTNIKHIERLILHRSHIKAFDRHDMEQVQIVFESEGVLVPFHGAFETFDGIVQFGYVVVFGVEAEGDVATGHGGVGGGQGA